MGVFIVLLLGTGCKKYLEIPLPVNSIAGSGAFSNDKASAAVLNNIYSMLVKGNIFDGKGFGYYSALYTDGLQSLANNPSTTTDQLFFADNITPDLGGTYWAPMYKQIYASNLVIEGVSDANNLNYKDQWLGEAYFLRALLHFYLTNLYGDVPIILTSDYTKTKDLPRSAQADVYEQIIKDLLQAQSLLNADYKNGKGAITTDRGRPNKMAATALLARVYLYTGDWADAITQAGIVIGNTAYELPAPAGAFLATSKELIWGLAPTASSYVKDYYLYNNGMPATVASFPFSNTNTALPDDLVNAFEPGDARYTNWTYTASSTGTPSLTYHFPFKYKSSTTGQEYVVLFRLAEQYLIRAEALAHQNKITGAGSAAADLDAVRSRAGLSGTTATTQEDMLAAILQERRVEFFCEEGHRLLDLRRTGKLDARMKALETQKNMTWKSFKQWWPIPSADTFANPAITQTPGYE